MDKKMQSVFVSVYVREWVWVGGWVGFRKAESCQEKNKKRQKVLENEKNEVNAKERHVYKRASTNIQVIMAEH